MEMRKSVSIVETSTRTEPCPILKRRSNTDLKLHSFGELFKLCEEGDEFALKLKKWPKVQGEWLTDNVAAVGVLDIDAVCGVSGEVNHSFYQSSSLKVEMYGNVKRYTEHVETNIQIERPNSSKRCFRQISAPTQQLDERLYDFSTEFPDFRPFMSAEGDFSQRTYDDGGPTSSSTFDAHLFQAYEPAVGQKSEREEEPQINFSVSELPDTFGISAPELPEIDTFGIFTSSSVIADEEEGGELMGELEELRNRLEFLSCGGQRRRRSVEDVWSGASHSSSQVKLPVV